MARRPQYEHKTGQHDVFVALSDEPLVNYFLSSISYSRPPGVAVAMKGCVHALLLLMTSLLSLLSLHNPRKPLCLKYEVSDEELHPASWCQ